MTADAIERLAEEIEDSAAILYGNADIRFSGSKSARLELMDALKELVALAERLREALIGAQFCLHVEHTRYRDSSPTDPGEVVGRDEGMEVIGETLNEISALIGPYYAGKVAALAGPLTEKQE